MLKSIYTSLWRSVVSLPYVFRSRKKCAVVIKLRRSSNNSECAVVYNCSVVIKCIIKSKGDDFIMKKNYAILRIKKYKSLSAVRSSERHGLERERVKHRINEDKENQNKYKFNGIYAECENLNQAYKKAVKNVKKTVRKDAVRVIEMVVSFSRQDNINPKLWIQDNVDFIRNTFGNESFLSCRLDMDESTPHLHFYICPLVHKKDGLHLCAKHYIGGRAAMVALQDNYASAMEKHGLCRGDSVKNQHIDTNKFWDKVKQETIDKIIRDIHR